MTVESYLRNYVRDIADFPLPGIQFKDITPLLKDSSAFRRSIEALVNLYDPSCYDSIGGFDARGFIFGSALAYQTEKPFFPLRKKGKLPFEIVEVDYGLEYGRSTLAIHRDAVMPGDKVLLVDDLLATGGTMRAGCTLVEKFGGEVVGCAFVVELADLRGRAQLEEYDVRSLIEYREV